MKRKIIVFSCVTLGCLAMAMRGSSEAILPLEEQTSDVKEAKPKRKARWITRLGRKMNPTRGLQKAVVRPVRQHGPRVLTIGAPAAFVFGGPAATMSIQAGARALAFAPLPGEPQAGETFKVPTRSEVDRAGKRPYLRYTLSAKDLEIASNSLFGEPAFRGNVKDISHLPRALAKELNVAGKEVWVEFPGEAAVKVLLSDQAVLLYHPTNKEPFYIADCFYNGKPWFNRVKLVEPLKPLARNDGEETRIVRIPMQNQEMSPTINVPPLPQPLQLSINGLPAPAAIPSNYGIKVEQIYRDETAPKKETFSQKFRNIGIGAGVGALGAAAVITSVRLPYGFDDGGNGANGNGSNIAALTPTVNCVHADCIISSGSTITRTSRVTSNSLKPSSSRSNSADKSRWVKYRNQNKGKK